MKETAKGGPVIQMDETVVQVIGEKDRKDTQNSYIWLALGGPPKKKVAWYEYHETRGGCHAKEFLGGYRSYLQTDGYPGYDSALEGNAGITHVGCFAHARRKFFEASKASQKPESAEEGIKSPHLTPDNNACENAIRPFVLGRKNWLFCQSPEGAESSCGIYSLIETAKQNGLVPAHYLTALFEKAPFASSSEDWEKLLPWNIYTA